MRQPQNAKRGRGRGRRGNGGGQSHAPNRNTSYESNGPDVKLRGNAQQLHEKYMALAHDAASTGERISAEAYTQFADHYFRLHQAAVGAAEARRQQEQPAEQRAPASDAEKSASGDQPEAASASDAEQTDQKDSADEAGKDAGAQVVSLSPAQLAEAVQDEQDTVSASS